MHSFCASKDLFFDLEAFQQFVSFQTAQEFEYFTSLYTLKYSNIFTLELVQVQVEKDEHKTEELSWSSTSDARTLFFSENFHVSSYLKLGFPSSLDVPADSREPSLYLLSILQCLHREDIDVAVA